MNKMNSFSVFDRSSICIFPIQLHNWAAGDSLGGSCIARLVHSREPGWVISVTFSQSLWWNMNWVVGPRQVLLHFTRISWNHSTNCLVELCPWQARHDGFLLLWFYLITTCALLRWNFLFAFRSLASAIGHISHSRKVAFISKWLPLCSIHESGQKRSGSGV